VNKKNQKNFVTLGRGRQTAAATPERPALANYAIDATPFVDHSVPCVLPCSVKDGEAAGAAGLSLIEQGKTQTIKVDAMPKLH